MPPARLSVLTGLLLWGAASCQVFFGVDEPSGSPSDDDSAGASGGQSGSSPTSSTGGQGAGAGPVGCDCLPKMPSGWDGPFLVYTTPAAEAFACPDDAAPSGTYYGEPPAAGATCAPCVCQPPMADCTMPKLTCYGNAFCASTGTPVTAANCAALPQSYDSCYVGPGDIQLGASTCVASGGEPSTVGWGLAAHACQLETTPEDGCDSDQCGAKDANGRRCIVQVGESVPCPLGWEEDSGPRWTGVVDTRGCSACGCGAATGACAGGAYKVGGSPTSCGLGGFEVGAGTCWGITAIGAAEVHAPSEPANVGCPPSQATAKGTFDPENPVTVCCEPSAG